MIHKLFFLKKKLMRLFFVFFVVFSFLYGNITKNIDIQNNFLNQKRVYKKLQNLKNQKILYHKLKKQKSLHEKNGRCFYIKKIKIYGITLLNKTNVQSIFKQYIGKCDTLSDIKNLINNLTSIYIDKGYITSKIYIKPQNLSKGILKLFAIEGKINFVEPKKLYIKNAFLGQEGRVLDLRNLEDSLEVINTLPSNHATMKIIPSKKTGYSDIVINNKTTKRISGTVGINNFGNKKTGKIQGSLSIIIDNILGINDQLNISINGTEKEFRNENSKGDSFVYSFPMGHFISSISYTNNWFQQAFQAIN